MTSRRTIGGARTPHAPDTEKLLEQYGCGPVQFTGTADALYERHLLFDNVIDPAAVGSRERYEAVARSVRDVLSQRWVRTENTGKFSTDRTIADYAAQIWEAKPCPVR